jgi:hypothetical protein
MTDWRENLVEDDARIAEILRGARTIAVLGIKPEHRRPKPAFTVPEYLQRVGYAIIPVSVYYPDVREILGRKIYRRVSDIPGPVDLAGILVVQDRCTLVEHRWLVR